MTPTETASLFARSLDVLGQDGTLVAIYRDHLIAEPLVGRVLQHSEHVVLVEKLTELYEHDGIAAIRPSDITRVKWAAQELGVASRVAAPARAEELRLNPVALLELSSALTLLQKRYGHVTVYTERTDPDVCYVGQELELDDDFVALSLYGSLKTLGRSEMLLRLDEITRVEAGGRYEAMLLAQFPRSA